MNRDRKIAAFESTIQASHQWVNEYGAELGQDHPQLAFRCLRAGLHALRDRLPVGEAVALAAQLPMLLRGAYFEGYAPNRTPHRAHTREQLYEHVSRELACGLGARPEDVMRALFALLDQRLEVGAIRKLRAHLPEEIRSMWPEPSTATRGSGVVRGGRRSGHQEAPGPR